MPIIEKGQVRGSQGFLKKRQDKDKRTRYQLLRKDKTHTDYSEIEVYVNGQKVELSDSSKYLLDMLIKDN